MTLTDWQLGVWLDTLLNVDAKLRAGTLPTGKFQQTVPTEDGPTWDTL